MDVPRIPALPPPPPGPGTVAEPEPEPEEKHHPLLAVAVAVAVLAAMAGIVVWLLRPVPCSGSVVTSGAFGYCVDPPSGWEAKVSETAGSTDRFVAEASPATVDVVAVRVSGSTGVKDFADQIRSLDDGVGLSAGELRRTEVDGRPAMWFEASAGVPGETLRMREVVIVNGGIAWRITFADTGEAYGHDVRAFDRFLASWRFR